MKQPVLASEQVKQAAMSGRRSALYRWMIENFHDFSQTVAVAGRPNWQALADMFGAAGLRDRVGKVPSADGARQTWWLVRQAVRKNPALAASTRPSPPLTPRAATLGERQPAPLQPSPAGESPVSLVDQTGPTPTRRRMEFRSARPLAEGEAPRDDGSKLPRPLHPHLKD